MDQSWAMCTDLESRNGVVTILSHLFRWCFENHLKPYLFLHKSKQSYKNGAQQQLNFGPGKVTDNLIHPKSPDSSTLGQHKG